MQELSLSGRDTLQACSGSSSSGVSAILAACRQLHNLNLTGCRWVSSDTLVGWASLCSGLQSLSLPGSACLTDAVLGAFCKGLASVNSLRLSDCGALTDAGVLQVAKVGGCEQEWGGLGIGHDRGASQYAGVGWGREVFLVPGWAGVHGDWGGARAGQRDSQRAEVCAWGGSQWRLEGAVNPQLAACFR